MKNLYLTTLLLIIVTSLTAQKPELAPVNPDFQEYLEIQKKGNLKSASLNKFGKGKKPAPYLHHFSANKISELKSATGEIPASYDLRNVEGGAYLTPVKNQGGSGTCWTFGTYGSVESYLLKQGKGTYDFSEQNLATCHGFNWGPDDGGNASMSVAYFTRHSGPVLESDDPYNEPDNSTSCNESFTPALFIDQARFLPGSQEDAFDMDLVKNALMEYGALHVDMTWEDDNYNSSDYSYIYTGSGSVNHDVLLVGWDDNKTVTNATVPGAWIIRNSWGEGWGENGFFYISYEDNTVLSTISYYPSAIDYNPNSQIYYYDELGDISGYGFGDGSDYGLVKFTARSSEQLTKIGVSIPSSNATVDFEVYGSFDGNTLSNYLGGKSGNTCALPGYHTFSLDDNISLNPNDDFYIKYKVTTPGYDYPIAVELEYNGYSDGVVIEEDKCWISNDGSSWSAIGLNSGDEYDLCVKAHTTLLDANTIYADFGSDIRSGLYNLTINFTDRSYGNVTDWEWDFDGDGVTDSYEQNPTYTYTEIGNYSVTLTVSDGTDSHSVTKSDYIEVKGMVTYNLDTPYLMDFESADDRNEWVINDANSDGTTWGFYDGYGTDESICAGYQYSSDNQANDWLVSPCFNLGSGTTYKLDFYARAYDQGYPENVSVYLLAYDGTGFDEVKNITAQEGLTNTTFELFSNTLSVDIDGKYNIGFKCHSNADMFALLIDDVNLSEDGSTGISDKKPLGNINIFPNPTKGMLNIQLNRDSEKVTKVNIANTTGQKVLTKYVDDQESIRIDLSSFNNGIYLVELVYDNESKVYKVVKK